MCDEVLQLLCDLQGCPHDSLGQWQREEGGGDGGPSEHKFRSGCWLKSTNPDFDSAAPFRFLPSSSLSLVAAAQLTATSPV